MHEQPSLGVHGLLEVHDNGDRAHGGCDRCYHLPVITRQYDQCLLARVEASRGVWQHSKVLGTCPERAPKSVFVFVATLSACRFVLLIPYPCKPCLALSCRAMPHRVAAKRDTSSLVEPYQVLTLSGGVRRFKSEYLKRQINGFRDFIAREVWS